MTELIQMEENQRERGCGTSVPFPQSEESLKNHEVECSLRSLRSLLSVQIGVPFITQHLYFSLFLARPQINANPLPPSLLR